MAYTGSDGKTHVSLHEASNGHAANTTASRNAAGHVVGNSKGSNYVRNQSSNSHKSSSSRGGFSSDFSYVPSPVRPEYAQKYVQKNYQDNNSSQPQFAGNVSKSLSFSRMPSFSSSVPVSAFKPPSQNIPKKNLKYSNANFNTGSLYGMPTRPTTSKNYVIEDHTPRSIKSGFNLIWKGEPLNPNAGKDMLAPESHITHGFMKKTESWGTSVSNRLNPMIDKVPGSDYKVLGLSPVSGAKTFTKGVVTGGAGFIGMAGQVPYGIETMARDPSHAFEKVGVGLGVMGAGMTKEATENPLGFAGQMVGMKYAPKVAKKTVVKPAAATGKAVARATGVIRDKTVTFTQYPHHPLGSQGAMIDAILDKPTISGARGFKEHFVSQEVSGAPIGIETFNMGGKQYTLGSLTRKVSGQDRQYLTRNYGSTGRVSGKPGDYATNVHGQYMTISPEIKGTTLMEKVGGHFLEKGGGNALSRRVHVLEDVPTVADALTPEITSAIKSDFSQFGKIRPRLYKEMQRAAVEKSARINQPVAIISPKTAQGFYKPELETLLVFGSDAATHITSSKFAGFSNKGTVVKKVRFGTQDPVSSNSFLKENAAYNWNKKTKYVQAMAEDMNRQIAELQGNALSKPGQYGPHGTKHIGDVESQLITLRKKSDVLTDEFDPIQAELASKIHDSARIWGKETEPIPHDQAAGLAVKMGFIDDPVLKSLPHPKQMQVAEAIMHHTDIRPGITSVAGLKTKFVQRPSEFAKAFASADRLARAAEQGQLKPGMVFPVPKDPTVSLFNRVTSNRLFKDTSAELFPVISKTKASKYPGIPKIKTSKYPGISKTKASEYPGISKTKASEYPVISKTKVSEYPGISKTKASKYPGIPKIKTSKYPGISKTKASEYPGIPKTKVSEYSVIPKTKVSEYPVIPKTKVSEYPVIPKTQVPKYPSPKKSDYTPPGNSEYVPPGMSDYVTPANYDYPATPSKGAYPPYSPGPYTPVPYPSVVVPPMTPHPVEKSIIPKPDGKKSTRKKRTGQKKKVDFSLFENPMRDVSDIAAGLADYSTSNLASLPTKKGRGKKTAIKIKTASEMMSFNPSKPASVSSRSSKPKPKTNTRKTKRTTTTKRRAKK